MKVKKRDGRIKKYEPIKIKQALKQCFDHQNWEFDERVYQIIIDTLESSEKEVIDVEEIQDLVVKKLNLFYPILAKSYQEYREERASIRDLNDNKDFYNTIEEIVNNIDNDTTKENANKDSRALNTKQDLIKGITSRRYMQRKVLHPEIVRLHNKGVIHIHDTDYRAFKGITNCCIFNLEDMLSKGTVINQKKIETPKSLKTATTISTQIVMGIGNSQYGGITMSLAHLAPYVEKSRIRYFEKNKNRLDNTPWRKFLKKTHLYNLWYSLNFNKKGFNKKLNKYTEEDTNKEIQDSMQTLQYQLNSMTANSGQSPFITVWMDINEKPEYIEETYLLIKALLEERIKGMTSETGHNISPAFPKLIYVLDENNVLPDSTYYDLTVLSAKCSSKRLTPDYVSAKIMRTIKEGVLTPAMGCRSFVSPYKDENGNSKTWGRFNIGVMTLNLPYIALESKTKKSFMKNLDKYLNIIKKEQLKVAKEISESSSEIAPMLWNYGAFARLPKGSKIGDLVYNGYATVSIGYAGIAETVEALGESYFSEEGHKLGLEIVKYMDDYCKKAKEETNLGFSLYGTPLESTTYKFAKAIKKFPTISKVNDRDYITNSYHIPVWQEVDAFTKLLFEAPFQEYSAGGCISYVEVPDVTKNVEAVIKIIQFIYDNIMYAEINTSNNDVCYNCGFQGEIENVGVNKYQCPECNNTDRENMSIVKRVCGYIGSSTYNEGREKEIYDRVKHL